MGKLCLPGATPLALYAEISNELALSELRLRKLSALNPTLGKEPRLLQ